jgi:hypothetical protein
MPEIASLAIKKLWEIGPLKDPSRGREALIV